jgi:ABC-type glycerol-3-phosphate transport system permease component
MLIKSRSARKRAGNVMTYVALVVIVLAINLPTVSMMGTALKGKQEALSSTALFPKRPHFENILNVLQKTTFGRNIINSFVVASCVTALCIGISSMAGYAISRFQQLRSFKSYAVMLLILQMFPLVLLLIPLFVIYKTFGLIDTPFSVLLSYTTINLPFSIWMLKGFFDTIPFALEESAMIDGCSQFHSYYRIVLPISAPGLSTVGIFTFVNSWNEYMLASIFLRSDKYMTLTVGLQKFTQQYTTDWAGLMTAATIATIPTLFVLMFAQKYLIQGLTAGAVKG